MTDIDISPKAVETVCESLQRFLDTLGRKGVPSIEILTLRALSAALTQSRADVSSWETSVSSVMPADFKDWHENSKAEWPTICAAVITELRHQVSCADAHLIQSRAETAAAYERAAGVAEYEATQCGPSYGNGYPQKSAWSIASTIRALATPRPIFGPCGCDCVRSRERFERSGGYLRRCC